MKKLFTTYINDKEIVEYLKSAGHELGDISQLMKIARVFLKNVVEENFLTEGKETGEKWKEWSANWKKQRLSKKRGEGRILGLEGDLRRSISASSGKDYALVGTNKEYAAIHNFGGSKLLKHNKTMPKREFLRLDEVKTDELFTELVFKVEEMLDKKKMKGM